MQYKYNNVLHNAQTRNKYFVMLSVYLKSILIQEMEMLKRDKVYVLN